MSSIWESGNPVTMPRRGVTVFAGLVLAVIAAGSMTLGLMAGWQRGESHEPGAAAASNAVEATPLAGPEVTLRSDASPNPPQAAEAPKTDTPAAAATPAAEAPSHRVTEGDPDEEAPPPTVTAPSPATTPQTGTAETTPPATTPDAPPTAPAGGQSATPAAPF